MEYQKGQVRDILQEQQKTRISGVFIARGGALKHHERSGIDRPCVAAIAQRHQVSTMPDPAAQQKTTETTLQQASSGKITRRVKTAIACMVWEGLNRQEAADKAGLKDNSLYVALRRPEVKAEYLAECEVLRISGRAKRLHHLEELAAQRVNMNASVAAIKVAEQIVDVEAERGGRRFAPGFVVIIGPAPPGFAPPPMVEVTSGPTIEHQAEPAAALPARCP